MAYFQTASVNFLNCHSLSDYHREYLPLQNVQLLGKPNIIGLANGYCNAVKLHIYSILFDAVNLVILFDTLDLLIFIYYILRIMLFITHTEQSYIFSHISHI